MACLTARLGHFGIAAREVAGRRRDLMAQEERGRREAQAYYVAHVRGVDGGEEECKIIFQCVNQLLQPCPQMGPYLGTRVPIGTFFGILGPYWVSIYFSGSLFSVFWLHSRKECQFSLHVYNNELS